MTLTIDPKGTWRLHRFDFCNALEEALSESTAKARRAKAWAELEKMGVRPATTEEKGK